MRRLPAFLLMFALAATLSCRGLPLALRMKPPSLDAPAATEQLQFVCDFPLPEESHLIRELREERDNIYTTLELPPSDEKITVHLFRDADSYHDVLARKFPMVPNRRAFFVESDMKLHVYAQWSDRRGEDLRHEVAHGYLHASVPAIPLWIDEGLAEYFEVPSGRGGLNQPHLFLLADLIEVNHWKPDLVKLEALNSAGEMQQEHYAEAWAWVYFLLNSTPERRELLTDYLAEVRAKGRAAPLSTRLAAQHIQPQRTLADYIVTLKNEQSTR